MHAAFQAAAEIEKRQARPRVIFSIASPLKRLAGQDHAVEQIDQVVRIEAQLLAADWLTSSQQPVDGAPGVGDKRSRTSAAMRWTRSAVKRRPSIWAGSKAMPGDGCAPLRPTVLRAYVKAAEQAKRHRQFLGGAEAGGVAGSRQGGPQQTGRYPRCVRHSGQTNRDCRRRGWAGHGRRGASLTGGSTLRSGVAAERCPPPGSRCPCCRRHAASRRRCRRVRRRPGSDRRA